MKKLLFTVAILALPVVANAAPGNGIDMQWQDCVNGALAVHDRAFNCTGNSTHNLNLNFKIAVSLPGFVAGTAFIDLQTSVPGPLAPFWHYESGGCQRMGGTSPNGVATSDALPATTDCTDNFSDIVNGDPSAGLDAIAAYGADVPSPGRGKFIVGVALGSAIPINAGDNKYLMQLNFNTRNRPNSVAPAQQCAGCGQQVAMVWNTLTLESNDGTPPYDVSGPDKGDHCATIANGQSICAPTAAKSRTWGSVKALYR
jgi:hypothetical protein